MGWKGGGWNNYGEDGIEPAATAIPSQHEREIPFSKLYVEAREQCRESGTNGETERGDTEQRDIERKRQTCLSHIEDVRNTKPYPTPIPMTSTTDEDSKRCASVRMGTLLMYTYRLVEI